MSAGESVISVTELRSVAESGAATPRAVTLVAVHGNGGGAFRFSLLPEHLPDHIRFNPVTLPGFAGVPRDDALQTVNGYAQKLREMIAHLPRPLVLLGTGIGGTFALAYAQQFALDGLILHAPVGTRLETRLFPRLMRLPGMARLGQRVFSTPLLRPFWRRRLFIRSLPPAVSRRFFDEYRQCQVFTQMFSIINTAWFDSLQPITTPAALLWGEEERVLTVDQLDDYKKLLPNHIVRTVPGWDHFPMLDDPAGYARELNALCTQLLPQNSTG